MTEFILFMGVYFFLAFALDNLTHHKKLLGVGQLVGCVGCAYILALQLT